MRFRLSAAAALCLALLCACSPRHYIPEEPLDLPAGKEFGVCAISVMNLREEPDFAGEAATQVLMGTLVRVMDRQGSWTQVVTPDGYQAWVTSGSLQCLTPDEAYEYKAAPKIIITSRYATMLTGKTWPNRILCDLVKGCILEVEGTKAGKYLCRTPDGREGLVRKGDARRFDKYFAAKRATQDNIVITAKSYMGVPYMWGGTSIKAVDCSGLTQSVFRDCGIILPRNASAQAQCGTDVSLEDGGKHLKKGDLLFFGRKRANGTLGIYHVALYIGDGEFIHSAGGRVKTNSLLEDSENYYPGCSDLAWARRILGASQRKGGFSEIIRSNWYF